MINTFFITATDTDAGKTMVASALLKAAAAEGMSTLALKPVAAGCEETPEGLRNDDALKLISAMTKKIPYEQVNPFALKAAIAPHIAAEQEGRSLSLSRLAGFCRGAFLNKVDFKLIEGAGGWRVPLNNQEMLSALAIEMGCEVILVVPLKLGCLNHALLTIEAIRRDGLKIAGWVGNHPDNNIMSVEDENLETLNRLMPAPCLGILPWQENPNPDELAKHLDIHPIIQKS
jgi:dethiobiotin synthetase